MNSRLFGFVAMSFAGAIGGVIGAQDAEHPIWLTVLLYAGLAVVIMAARVGTWVLKNDQRWEAQLTVSRSHRLRLPPLRRGKSKPTNGTRVEYGRQVD
ncbi:hypothetical protein G3T36_09030 [Diaminobutyricibacter tongyongensis]|uniref:Uncharacterized protein n=1 Tax=Leifsonia tongyongensis TaxID=1268043 RepID=A0A6L9XXS5_9MICO|nr:hypothetical protein [Diaminobutyricibacter tongyongensis]NEN06017.1 hypothetical protein [Diaminobutyricibacter tongyongensis]